MSAHYRTGESPEAGDIIDHDEFSGIGFVFEGEDNICAYFPHHNNRGHSGRGSNDVEELINHIGQGSGQWVLVSGKSKVSGCAIDADLLARNGKLTAAGRKFIGIDRPKSDISGEHIINIDGVEYDAILTKKE